MNKPNFLLDDIDDLCNSLNESGSVDVLDAAEYLAKNLDPRTLEAFKEGIDRVKV